MKKEVLILSLGGSLIIPNKINFNYLKKFKEILLKNTNKYKFVVVCGGGSIAREYITALKQIGKDERFQSLIGISSTRTNARFMSYFFGLNPIKGIPHTMYEIQHYLKEQDIVFCGALEYQPHQTSDSTSAEIAQELKARFINLTNVPKGLHDKNPLEHKDAKFIPKISWKEFEKMANKIKFKPGLHFVLDSSASKIILRNKIPTYIIGDNVKELENFLKNKKFIGTTISG
ncbi:MAG: UMP kinase [Candidatus Pacearchaeota archaeon]|jgi:uridylate kinase